MSMAPDSIAVVLVAHGERGGTFANSALLAHAAAVREEGPFAAVTAGVLNGVPTFEQALSEAAQARPPAILVYPFFMADGYFSNVVVPRRIAAAGLGDRCHLLPPLGLDRGLPSLLLADALATAAGAGLDPAASRLLVVGHGSKSARASARATEEVAVQISRSKRFQSVAIAFIEEPPFLDDMLVGRQPPTVIAGFFSGDGLHAAEDIPQAVKMTGANAVYSGAVGGKAAVAELIVAAVLGEAGVIGNPRVGSAEK